MNPQRLQGGVMRDDTAALYAEVVQDETLRLAALTRKAFLLEDKENGEPDPRGHHEALEHLGDAWLGAVVAGRLFNTFVEAQEKELTVVRTSLVDEASLAEIARAHEVGASIRAGNGEKRQEQHLTSRSLAAHLEAMLGAAFVAGGVTAVERMIDHLWEGRWPSSLSSVRGGDYKSALQRHISRTYRKPGTHATYEPEQDYRAPDHLPRVRALVTTPWCTVYGDWRSKRREAEQDAARVALSMLEATVEAPPPADAP
jgi:ribonuclease-3